MTKKCDFFYFFSKKEKFRSRAAFKLIELNRKFKFLNNATGVLDLCSAPGSWLEVAKKLSPKQALLIGVDIKRFKPIGGCKIIEGDITSLGCKNIIRKTIAFGKQKVNVVLNDGAPKMGTDWVRDSFNQNDLALKALSLAVEFLPKNGCFVTKIFRSQFFNRILFVFQSFFEEINIFKPLSSRKSSAEVFLVCQKFRPKFIDNDFFINSARIFGTVGRWTGAQNFLKDSKNFFRRKKNQSILKFFRNTRDLSDVKFSPFFLNDELESSIGIIYFCKILSGLELGEKKSKLKREIFIIFLFLVKIYLRKPA